MEQDQQQMADTNQQALAEGKDHQETRFATISQQQASTCNRADRAAQHLIPVTPPAETQTGRDHPPQKQKARFFEKPRAQAHRCRDDTQGSHAVGAKLSRLLAIDTFAPDHYPRSHTRTWWSIVVSV